MNRAGKTAFSWLMGQSDLEKISFIAKAVASDDYQQFVARKKTKHFETLPFDFLKNYTPRML